MREFDWSPGGRDTLLKEINSLKATIERLKAQLAEADADRLVKQSEVERLRAALENRMTWVGGQQWVVREAHEAAKREIARLRANEEKGWGELAVRMGMDFDALEAEVERLRAGLHETGLALADANRKLREARQALEEK
jgi:chromosome segregation ATPase